MIGSVEYLELSACESLLRNLEANTCIPSQWENDRVKVEVVKEFLRERCKEYRRHL